MKSYRLLFILAALLAAAPALRAQGPSLDEPAANSVALDPDAADPAQEDPAMLLQQADALRAEKSFRMAREIYEKLLDPKRKLDPAQRTHARVFAMDCLWRERAEPDTAERAAKELGRLLEDLPADSVWRAEAAESLGDLRNETGRWDQKHDALAAWLSALKYWGEAANTQEARPRYIALNFRIAEYAMNMAPQGWFPYPEDPIILRLGILPPPPPPQRPWEGDLISWALRNALRVTEKPEERAHALFLLGAERANTPRNVVSYPPPPQAPVPLLEGQRPAPAAGPSIYPPPVPDPEAIKERDERWAKEAEDYLKQAAAIQPRNPWTDQALWTLAQFYENRERYKDAARTAEELLQRFAQSETAHFDEAQAMLKRITQPSVQVQTGETYAPESYIHVQINYRNIDRITLHLLRVTPETFIEAQRNEKPEEILQAMTGEEVRKLVIPGIVDAKDHVPHAAEQFVEPLPPGIYMAELEAPGAASEPARRSLFRVSRLALAARPVEGGRDQVFITDAETGRPLEGARVWAVYKSAPVHPAEWVTREGRSGAQGIAPLERPVPPRFQGDYLAQYYAEREGHFATTQQWGGWYRPLMGGGTRREWTVYTETDRPAYRPAEPIHWKAILRASDGKGWRLPEKKSVYVIIRDERSQIAYEGDAPLSEYGSTSGTITLDRQAALGMLMIELKEAKGGDTLAAAQLCRLEEYKLPEYKVSVEPGKEQLRFGAAVPFTVRAEYYFGGPVAGAEVEVIVHRRAFWPFWRQPRPYPWLYEDEAAGGARMEWMPWIWPRIEPEQIVLTKKVATDAEGRVRLEAGALTAEEIRQARDRGIWGYEFRVEARVVDASRREVRDSGSVRTALTAFAAYLNPQCYLYLPGDPVKLDLKTLDPNDHPVAAEGFVTMYKRVWRDDRKNAAGGIEPGYDDVKLVARPALTTAKDGAATIEFTPDEPGCYFFRYETRDKFGEPVHGETVVFVAGRDTRRTGYRSGGVTIITDKETYALGETAHVLLAVRRPGAAVWFSVEGEAIHRLEVVPIEGTVKMLDVPVTAELQPNFFITAVAMFDYGDFRDTRRLVAPPKEQFLKITLKSPKEVYKPGEKAAVEVEVRDDAGKPVATELSLGVADAAVWAIQGDLVPDIRQAFWNRQRGLNFNVSSSPQQGYTQRWRLKKGAPGQYEEAGREGELPTSDDDRLGRRTRRGGGIREESLIMSRTAGAAYGAMAMAEGAPMPTAAPMKAAVTSYAKGVADSAGLGGGGVGQEAMAPAQLRTDFSATALWLPALVTGADGRARAEVTFPDSLTTWKLTARAADKQTRVGQAREETRTSKSVLVRPQGPRFFTQGDSVILSAIVNNNTSQTLPVEVALDVTGLQLTAFSGEETAGSPAPDASSTEPVPSSQPQVRIVVPAQGQRRVDWRVLAPAPGQAVIKTTARSALDSDAVQRSFPVHEYGIEQFIASGAVIKGIPDTIEKKIVLDIPANRRPGSEALTVSVEPTLVGAMVGALDYLAQYPYGCVEQTLSRFVPAVITLRVIRQLGLHKPELEAKLPDMIQAGLSRLRDFQHSDGGWGWWKDDPSDLYMTAYVLQGLSQAARADVAVEPDMLARAERYLTAHLIDVADQPDLTAFMLYALTQVRNASSPGEAVKAAFERLWEQRERLNSYTRALFALACWYNNQPEMATTIGHNMRNGVVVDKETGTAHWGSAGGYYRWSDGPVEATAFSLRALLLVEPESELVEQSMLWLVRNRRGSRWESTKDTALAIRALVDYVRGIAEDKADWRAEVEVNGRRVATLRVTPESLWDFNGKIEIPASALQTGRNEIVIRRIGSGTLYASAWLTYFTREQEIKPAGNEVFAQRQFFRTVVRPTLSGAYKTVREELKPGMALRSGERVEVELTLEAKNDYEYLVVEDLKAAGMEPTAVKSGFDGGGGLLAHRELRDEKTAFFITRLPQGKHKLKYELRAEVPGTFAALPALVHAMYVPEIRANSAGAKVEIRDKE